MPKCDAPQSMESGGGNYLTQRGTYHVVITQVKSGEGPKGGAIDGFTFDVDVLAGTSENCQGKVHSEVIFLPDMSKSEESQERSKQKIAAFGIAANLQTPEDLFANGINYDESEAIEEQMLIKFRFQQKKNDETGEWEDTKFLQISFADIFHVDDPEVASIPKNEEALALIDKSKRHSESWFAFKGKKTQAAPAQKASSFADIV